MSFKRRIFLPLMFLFVFVGVCQAQHIVVKSNMLYDLTTTLNVGVEGAVAPQWTIEGSINYNPWTFGQTTKIRQLTFQPEARYWLCRTFSGHFFGVDLLGGLFNIGHIHALKLNKINRYDGWAAGLGLAYGYDWVLSPRWNIEASLAAGYERADYQVYRCSNCGRKIGARRHTNYVGPTKAAVSIVYVIK